MLDLVLDPGRLPQRQRATAPHASGRTNLRRPATPTGVVRLARRSFIKRPSPGAINQGDSMKGLLRKLGLGGAASPEGTDSGAAQIEKLKQRLADDEGRIEAIAALEGIAREDASAHWTVMEIFVSHVRERCPSWTIDGAAKPVADDVAAILEAIGRRKWVADEKLGLGLFQVDLRGADLTGADLRRADFSRSHLGDADFAGSRLDEANFQEAFLDSAKMLAVQLAGANFLAATSRTRTSGERCWTAAT